MKLTTEKKEKNDHVVGPPWRIAKRFVTFKEANEFRNGVLTETDSVQAKVRWSRLRDDYIVKTRVDPAVVASKKKKKRKK